VKTLAEYICSACNQAAGHSASGFKLGPALSATVASFQVASATKVRMTLRCTVKISGPMHTLVRLHTPVNTESRPPSHRSRSASGLGPRARRRAAPQKGLCRAAAARPGPSGGGDESRYLILCVLLASCRVVSTHVTWVGSFNFLALPDSVPN
jgi:hypothetical protein